jgi:hypothetical protein
MSSIPSIEPRCRSFFGGNQIPDKMRGKGPLRLSTLAVQAAQHPGE